MMYNYGFGNWFGFNFGWIFSVLFWILIVWVIVALSRGGRHHRYWDNWEHWMHKDKTAGALAILNERYAKGEIPKAEYEEKKQDLLK